MEKTIGSGVFLCLIDGKKILWVCYICVIRYLLIECECDFDC